MQAPFERLRSTINWRQWWRGRRQHQNEPSSTQNDTRKDYRHRGNTSHEEAMQQERVRRETEARAKREQTERERQEQHTKAPPPEATYDPRSPEEILGLTLPWTPESLKIAYRREAGRTHPDKWIGKPEAIRQAMEAEYKNIQDAYRRLRA